MTETIEKLPLTSQAPLAERFAILRETFPEIFREGKIDVETFRQVIGEAVDTGPERYGLSWAGKAAALRNIQTPSIGTLIPDRAASVEFNTTENVFIEGDNLEVLKLLQKGYYGKVKLIYIDPPYNTGNEFIYPDNFTEGLDTYLRYSGQVTGEGVRVSTNTETSGRYHSRWLDMMYPRLFLAKNLLREDGVICVSIDDHEVHNLRLLMDEVFGPERFIAELVWKSRQNKDDRALNGVSTDHEYVLCYGLRVRGDERKPDQYSNPDKDPRGPWASANMVGLATEDRRPNLHYDLVDPNTGINYGKPRLGWRYDPSTMARLIAEKRILWPPAPDGRPRRKAFFSELREEYTAYSSIIGTNVFTRNGTADIERLFGERVMDFPKPTQLIKEIIVQGCDDDGIVLDCFAGSCTTADAILSLNREDGGNRRFIMVQLPEPTPEGSVARKLGYASIADIGKERIRRVIKKIEAESADKLPLNGAQAAPGFRAFKLAESNFRVWNSAAATGGAEQLAQQLALHIDHVQPHATPESILYEILLKSGFPLTAPVAEVAVADARAFAVADGLLLVCLAEVVTVATIGALIARKPEQVVCLDAAFGGNDQLKTNTVLQMRDAGITFHTV
jgi:adenine-specific DNA-methyltransferase